MQFCNQKKLIIMIFLKKSTLLILCLFLTVQIIAQDVVWMPQNKFSKKDDFFSLYVREIQDQKIILGNSNAYAVLDANTLELKREYEKSYKASTTLFLDGQKVGFRTDAKLLKPNNPTCIYYKSLDDESAKEQKLICHDLYSNKKNRKIAKKESRKNGGIVSLGIVSSSKNGKWIVRPFTNYIDKTIDHFVYNEKLELIYEKKIPYLQNIDNKEMNLNIALMLVLDEGDIQYLGYNDHPKGDKFEAFVLTYNRTEDKIFSFISKPTKNKVFSSTKDLSSPLMYNNFVNANRSVLYGLAENQIIYAGIYKNKEDKEEGVFIGRFDYANNTFQPFQEIPFSQDMMAKIRTKNNSKKDKKFKAKVLLKELIFKKNKDVIILAEVDGTKSNIMTSFDDGEFNDRLKTDLEVKEILYFNFNPQNELSFSGLIDKHQRKGEKEQASFVAVVVENTTHILFNVMDKIKSSIVSYSINEDGEDIKEREIHGPSKKLLRPNRVGLSGAFFIGNIEASRFSNLTNKGEILLKGIDGERSTIVKIKL